MGSPATTSDSFTSHLWIARVHWDTCDTYTILHMIVRKMVQANGLGKDLGNGSMTGGNLAFGMGWWGVNQSRSSIEITLIWGTDWGIIWRMVQGKVHRMVHGKACWKVWEIVWVMSQGTVWGMIWGMVLGKVWEWFGKWFEEGFRGCIRERFRERSME